MQDYDALPTLVRQQIEQAKQRTDRVPENALSDAIELDRWLVGQGVQLPVTYAAAGVTDGQVAPVNATRPHKTLYSASQRTEDGEDPLSFAYQHASGPELPALNLLYANQSRAVESLWLRFLNKYLAHFDGIQPGPHSLRLSPGVGSRLNRLAPSRTPRTLEQAQLPLVSVLMPVYNAETTLRRAVGSMLEQTWPRLEVLVIDDCSTDGSLHIARQLEAEDARVRVIALRKNGGPYIAKNVGLTRAVGDYITVHDADDWAFPNRIEDQMRPFLQRGSHIKVTMGLALRMQHDGLFTRFEPVSWLTPDGGIRLCFPSLLFEKRYFESKLGAWVSVMVGADYEMYQRIRRFEPEVLQQLPVPVMIQLDAENSLTRSEATHNDHRGEARVRQVYRAAWSQWHAAQASMPRLSFPLRVRPFEADRAILTHSLGIAELV